METVKELNDKLFEYIIAKFPNDPEMHKLAVYTAAMGLILNLEKKYSDEDYFTISQFCDTMEEFINFCYLTLVESTMEE